MSSTPTAPSGRDRHQPIIRRGPIPSSHPALAEPPTDAAAGTGRLDTVVFGVAAVVALAFVAWGFLAPSGLGSASGGALTWIETNLGWLFVVLASGFVVYVLWLAASRYGRIPLGRDGEAPEFRTVSWVAMMFSAGMGIGLMFYGVSEPLSHYVSPPPGTVSGESAVTFSCTRSSVKLSKAAARTFTGVATCNVAARPANSCRRITNT